MAIHFAGTVIGGTIWLSVIQAQVTSSPPECVRVCLPQESTNRLPADAFIDAVNDGVRRGKGQTFCVVSADQALAKFAKVILHSYSIGEQRMRFAATDKDCPPTTNALPTAATPPPQFRTVFVVLGNLPLDDSTPTVDMLQRLFTAIPNVRGRRDAALVLTGAPTAGPISEARMMALIALSRGVAREQIILEEESWTTGRNAALTAPIVERLGAKSVFIVSKKSHLAFAMAEFRKFDVYRAAVPLESPEVRAEGIRQMEEYLKLHNNPGIETRLEALRADSHGVD